MTEIALWARALLWRRIQTFGQKSSLHVTASIFPHKLDWLFGQYPRYRRKRWALLSFVISTCELWWVVGMLSVSIADFVVLLCHCLQIKRKGIRTCS
jgi:hypothetical protein